MDLRHIDIAAIADRYRLTFARENHDRPLICLSFPDGPKPDLPPEPPTVWERWFNFEWRLDCYEKHLARTGFLREGFPAFHCNLGPDFLAACMGSELEFADSTSWAKFRVKDWSQEPPLRFHRDGYYWQQMRRFLTLCMERGQGRWLGQSGDLHTNGDGLAALRGPQDLLTDLFDCPEEIHKRLAECHAVFAEVLQAHFDIILPGGNGYSSCWCSAAVKGRYATIQNDFCCMVGPAQFDEFFKTYIQAEAALLDACVYHLDGPGAVRHLDSICQSPALHAIQWVPGAGNKPVSEWPDLLKRVQAHGKGLWLHGSPREQLDMMAYLKPEGCMYNVWLGSRAEAEGFLREADAILNQHRPATVARP